jgi:hypothetical protein
MKLFKLGLIFCIFLTSLMSGGAVLAADGDLPDPGITPDSPFYFLDTFGKNIAMFFTFGAEAKAGKALEYAEERLAEVKVMAERNRFREMERAADDYENYMNMVGERLAEVGQDGDTPAITETVAAAAARHMEILDSIGDTATAEGAPALVTARTASQDGQMNALRALGESQPDKALAIVVTTIEGRLERVRTNAGGNADEITGDLNYAASLAEMEAEMELSAPSEQLNIAAIEQRLSEPGADREAIVAEISGLIPEISIGSIKNALDSSLGSYENAIESILGSNTGASANETDMERLRREIDASMRLTTANQ